MHGLYVPYHCSSSISVRNAIGTEISNACELNSSIQSDPKALFCQGLLQTTQGKFIQYLDQGCAVAQLDYAALVAACPVEDLSQALKFAPGEALLCLSAAVYEVQASHGFLLDW